MEGLFVSAGPERFDSDYALVRQLLAQPEEEYTPPRVLEQVMALLPASDFAGISIRRGAGRERLLR